MEDSKVCPFSTLKSSNLKKSSNSRNVNNSNKTPCPIVNVLINKGELNPTREWTREEIRNVLKKNKLTSNIFSNLFVTILSKSLSVKKLQDDDLKVISLIPNIMGMMGDRMPMLLKETDVRRILKDDTLEDHIDAKKLKYISGEQVKVNEGPFTSFEGTISEVKGDRVDVEIKIFGRNTAVSLMLSQIEKI